MIRDASTRRGMIVILVQQRTKRWGSGLHTYDADKFQPFELLHSIARERVDAVNDPDRTRIAKRSTSPACDIQREYVKHQVRHHDGLLQGQ